MASKLYGSASGSKELLFNIAKSTGLFDDNMFSSLEKEDEQIQYLNTIAGTIDVKNSAFNDFEYSHLTSSQDKYNYVITKFYNQGDVEADKYFQEVVDYNLDQEVKENISAFQKTAGSIGYLIGNAANETLGRLIEGSLDIYNTLFYQEGRMLGSDKINTKTRSEVVGEDTTGVSTRAAELREWASKYSYLESSQVMRVANDVITGLGKLSVNFIPGAGQFLYFAAMAGNTSEDLYRQNPNVADNKALGYLATNVGIEFLTERLFGLDAFFGKGIINNAALNLGKTILLRTTQEAVEEGAAEIFNSLAYYAWIDRDASKIATIDQVAYAALIGGLIGAISTGGQIYSQEKEITAKDANGNDFQIKGKTNVFNFKNELSNTIKELDKFKKNTYVADLREKLKNKDSTNLTLSEEQLRKKYPDEFAKVDIKQTETRQKIIGTVAAMNSIYKKLGAEGFGEIVNLLEDGMLKKEEQIKKWQESFDANKTFENRVIKGTFGSAVKTIEKTYPGNSALLTEARDSASLTFAKNIEKKTGRNVVFAEFTNEKGTPEISGVLLVDGILLVNEKDLIKYGEKTIMDSIHSQEMGVLLSVTFNKDSLDEFTNEFLAAFPQHKAKIMEISPENRQKFMIQLLLKDNLSIDILYRRDKSKFKKILNFLFQYRDTYKNSMEKVSYYSEIINRYIEIAARNKTGYSELFSVANTRTYDITKEDYDKLTKKYRKTDAEYSVVLPFDVDMDIIAKTNVIESLFSSTKDIFSKVFDRNRIMDETYYKEEFVNTIMGYRNNLKDNSADFTTCMNAYLLEKFSMTYSPVYKKFFLPVDITNPEFFDFKALQAIIDTSRKNIKDARKKKQVTNATFAMHDFMTPLAKKIFPNYMVNLTSMKKNSEGRMDSLIKLITLNSNMDSDKILVSLSHELSHSIFDEYTDSKSLNTELLYKSLFNLKDTVEAELKRRGFADELKTVDWEHIIYEYQFEEMYAVNHRTGKFSPTSESSARSLSDTSGFFIRTVGKSDAILVGTGKFFGMDYKLENIRNDKLVKSSKLTLEEGNKVSETLKTETNNDSLGVKELKTMFGATSSNRTYTLKQLKEEYQLSDEFAAKLADKNVKTITKNMNTNLKDFLTSGDFFDVGSDKFSKDITKLIGEVFPKNKYIKTYDDLRRAYLGAPYTYAYNRLFGLLGDTLLGEMTNDVMDMMEEVHGFNSEDYEKFTNQIEKINEKIEVLSGKILTSKEGSSEHKAFLAEYYKLKEQILVLNNEKLSAFNFKNGNLDSIAYAIDFVFNNLRKNLTSTISVLDSLQEIKLKFIETYDNYEDFVKYYNDVVVLDTRLIVETSELYYKNKIEKVEDSAELKDLPKKELYDALLKNINDIIISYATLSKFKVFEGNSRFNKSDVLKQYTESVFDTLGEEKNQAIIWDILSMDYNFTMTDAKRVLNVSSRRRGSSGIDFLNLDNLLNFIDDENSSATAEEIDTFSEFLSPAILDVTTDSFTQEGVPFTTFEKIIDAVLAEEDEVLSSYLFDRLYERNKAFKEIYGEEEYSSIRKKFKGILSRTNSLEGIQKFISTYEDLSGKQNEKVKNEYKETHKRAEEIFYSVSNKPEITISDISFLYDIFNRLNRRRDMSGPILKKINEELTDRKFFDVDAQSVAGERITKIAREVFQKYDNNTEYFLYLIKGINQEMYDYLKQVYDKGFNNDKQSINFVRLLNDIISYDTYSKNQAEILQKNVDADALLKEQIAKYNASKREFVKLEEDYNKNYEKKKSEVSAVVKKASAKDLKKLDDISLEIEQLKDRLHTQTTTKTVNMVKKEIMQKFAEHDTLVKSLLPTNPNIRFIAENKQELLALTLNYKEASRKLSESMVNIRESIRQQNKIVNETLAKLKMVEALKENVKLENIKNKFIVATDAESYSLKMRAIRMTSDRESTKVFNKADPETEMSFTFTNLFIEPGETSELTKEGLGYHLTAKDSEGATKVSVDDLNDKKYLRLYFKMPKWTLSRNDVTETKYGLLNYFVEKKIITPEVYENIMSNGRTTKNGSDDDTLNMMFVEALEDAGYSGIIYPNGSEGINVIVFNEDNISIEEEEVTSEGRDLSTVQEYRISGRRPIKRRNVNLSTMPMDKEVTTPIRYAPTKNAILNSILYSSRKGLRDSNMTASQMKNLEDYEKVKFCKITVKNLVTYANSYLKQITDENITEFLDELLDPYTRLDFYEQTIREAIFIYLFARRAIFTNAAARKRLAAEGAIFGRSVGSGMRMLKEIYESADPVGSALFYMQDKLDRDLENDPTMLDLRKQLIDAEVNKDWNRFNKVVKQIIELIATNMSNIHNVNFFKGTREERIEKFKNFIKKTNSFRYLAMLSSPSTHLGNIVSNFGQVGLNKVVGSVETILQSVMEGSKVKSIKEIDDKIKNFSTTEKDSYEAEKAALTKTLTQGTLTDAERIVAQKRIGLLEDKIASFPTLKELTTQKDNLEKQLKFKLAKKEKITQTTKDYVRVNLIDSGYWEKLNFDSISKFNKSRGSYEMKAKQKIMFQNKVLMKGYNLELASLEGVDERFTKGMTIHILEELVQANYGNDVSKIDAVAFEALATRAIKMSMELFLRNDNAFAKWWMRTSDKNILLETLMGGPLPFPRVASNVLLQIYKISPLRLGEAIYTHIFSKPKAEQHDFYATLTRKYSEGIVGTALMFIGLALAQFGVLGVSDDEQDGIVLNVGKNGEVFKLKLSEMAPSFSPMLLGASILAMGDLSDGADAVKESLFQQTLLGNINSLFRYNSSLDDALIKAPLETYISQYVPSILKSITKVIDPNEKDTGGKYKLFKRIVASLPIASNLLIANKIDPYTGTARHRNEGVILDSADDRFGFDWVSALNLVNPIKLINKDSSPLQEVGRILDEVATTTTGTFVINSSKITLSSKAKEVYATKRAEVISSMMTKIVKDSKFLSMSEADKKKEISSIYDLATQIAKVNYWLSKGNKYAFASSDSLNKMINYLDTRKGAVVIKAYKGSRFIANKKG